MRWDNMRLDQPEDGAASGGGCGTGDQPLFARGAVTRTFDTPGFRGMTFYEIQAKSIVNRVPATSRMAFGWTINPYRGCQHACTYCQAGETPILMANGRTKRLADVCVGDAIYGTVRDGFYRRYVITTVLAHWSTVKPAYRITLADGTQLIASGEHRYLTERGWKHVTGAEQGPLQRPFLTVDNKLMGVGKFAEPPKNTVDYRRGYLCGMIRGDGHLGRQFRLALVDEEGLAQTRYCLGTFGIVTTERTFAEAQGNRKAVRAIYVSSRGEIEAIRHFISWPEAPTTEWRKGFLAGIFDAEGSCSRGVWRVSNTDPKIIDATVDSLAALGFHYVLEPPRPPNGIVTVRLRGGVREAIRFFHTTDPAITRKRSIDGFALKSGAKLQVAEIKPLGIEMPMYDITTGTGDFIANGVVSHNCFARNTHTYLDLDAGHDFDSKVVVKVNAPELLRKKLASASWPGEHIAMGTNVDCYQRAEGKYQLMRGIISALRDAANPFSILTKGTLILRDLDLLTEAAQVTDVGLNVSAGFVDKTLWRTLEPGTPSPERRLDTCKALTDAGLSCGVLMGPIVPFLSDSPEQLDEAVRRIAASGAVHVTPIILHLRPGTREWYLQWLNDNHPELVRRYLRFYGRGAYAPKAYQAELSGRVRELAQRYGVGATTPAAGRRIGPPVPPPSPKASPETAAAPEPLQLSLL
ncbi:MAG TPA: intein-containing Rv2578c family radical SAM protein [Streptosporangiaceae bacterium]|nr:intein-containing Rv2578c family radical SAM protein [Streptosporangiaceae bacterium]